MRVWVLLLLPLSAWACDACRDADAAKQSFMSSVVAAPPSAETPATAAEAPKPSAPRERASSGEPSIGGSTAIVPASKPRNFIRSFNELK